MTSLGKLLTDAVYDRIDTALPTIPLFYEGDQGSGVIEYILFLDEDEAYAPQWSDKDGDANEVEIQLQLWGADPRTLADRAKTIIDDISDKDTPPPIAGFYHLQTRVNSNKRMPKFTTKDQATQHARMIRIQYTYHPN